jgi:hypothetical protein
LTWRAGDKQICVSNAKTCSTQNALRGRFSDIALKNIPTAILSQRIATGLVLFHGNGRLESGGL